MSQEYALDDVMLRLSQWSHERLHMINRLALGVRIKFAPRARMFVRLNEAETAALRAHRPVQKLQVLVDAARSSNEWVDEMSLPDPKPEHSHDWYGFGGGFGGGPIVHISPNFSSNRSDWETVHVASPTPPPTLGRTRLAPDLLLRMAGVR